MQKFNALLSEMQQIRTENALMRETMAEIQAVFAELKKPIEPANPRPLVYGEMPSDGHFSF